MLPVVRTELHRACGNGFADDWVVHGWVGFVLSRGALDYWGMCGAIHSSLTPYVRVFQLAGEGSNVGANEAAPIETSNLASQTCGRPKHFIVNILLTVSKL